MKIVFLFANKKKQHFQIISNVILNETNFNKILYLYERIF